MTTIYLHGFLSSPRSVKGRMLAAAHERRRAAFFAPDLNIGPAQAASLLLQLTEGIPARSLAVVGSSLGGFYAAWLAEKRGCRAVLLNPAVRPWEFVKDYMGEQPTVAGDRTVNVTPDFVRQLRELDVPEVTRPERYLVLLSTADETLDWREADAKYREATRVLIPGGDHRISAFADYCEAVTDFCCSGPAAA